MPTADTTRFGRINFKSSDVIHFVRPILGFNDLSQYVMISRPESEPFKWLQSVENPKVCFVLVDPRLLVEQYSIEISEHDIKLLSGSNIQEDYQIYVIATVPKGHPELMSVNLQGPVVIYVKQLTAIQMVLSDPKYDIRYSLFKQNSTAQA